MAGSEKRDDCLLSIGLESSPPELRAQNLFYIVAKQRKSQVGELNRWQISKKDRLGV